MLKREMTVEQLKKILKNFDNKDKIVLDMFAAEEGKPWDTEVILRNQDKDVDVMEMHCIFFED